ncbi:acyl-CoA dehydrogenase [Tardibacter chloracetimidivorans]|uniref:Acyl-CoA dehydrogenase n=1 Tax=Tardibacter chloracetimidivorans TaxID=1921510 RepID=A0A1L3ZWB0_9SPHN|nr:acyl-CoA dehydrogenase family protein [Tardibacter chloracetimidivorans]API59917.1 acyl-CoA dehydrogenase [Tardibacter chloracetimidivorans]
MADPIDYNSYSDEDFRATFRAWLEANYPERFRQTARRPFYRLRGADIREWLALLCRDGWRVPGWPREHGGMGLDFRKQLIYHTELERIGAARVVDMAETQLGPIIIQHGTPEQIARYIPPMLSGEHFWCQGYSEPNAGSDLASLRTSAEVTDNGFVVNGQKIWTTQANDATHIFLLARTGKFGRKQKGISFLLAPIDAPGITLRPIVNLAGEDEFCEVFFDNVELGRDALVGELHEGWGVAKALLGYERVWNGSPALAGKALALARLLVEKLDKGADQQVMHRLAVLASDHDDYCLLYNQYTDRLANGERPGPECSMLKIYASELLQRLTEFNLEVAGSHGLMIGEFDLDGIAVDLHWQLMMSRPPTIFAGANEVQRNILAKSLLRMPQ